MQRLHVVLPFSPSGMSLDFEFHYSAVFYAERVGVMEYARARAACLRLPAYRAGSHRAYSEVRAYERQQVDKHLHDDFQDFLVHASRRF